MAGALCQVFKMVSGSCLNNNSMDTYKLLDLSGSDSENEVIHFAPMPDPPQRKKRLKRRERDLLRVSQNQVDEETGRVCSCMNINIGGNGCQPWISSPGGAVRSALLLIALIGLSLLTWLALHLQARLDATQNLINSVEASSSELPAKFHESHVRLQELEKNQSALWAHVNDVSSSLAAANKRVEQLEIDVKTIKDSLSSAPQLSSLPKDVANLQGSVATFGSTLQDVQSSLKVVKQDQDKLSEDMKVASASIDSVKKEISVLHNQTAMDGGRESGFGGSETVGEAVVNLKQHVNSLTSAVGAVNASLHSHIDEASTSLHKLKNIGVSAADLNNVTQRMTTMEAWRETIDSSLTPQVTNLSLTTSQLQASSDHHSQILQNVTQSVEVVKGVERKLEGSQVQLASGVSDLKQQIQKVDQKVNNLLEQSSTPAPQANNETHSHSGTLRDKRGP